MAMPDRLDIRQVGTAARFPFTGVTEAAASGTCCVCGKATVETRYGRWCCYGDCRRALGVPWGPGVALGDEPATVPEAGETTKGERL